MQGVDVAILWFNRLGVGVLGTALNAELGGSAPNGAVPTDPQLRIPVPDNGTLSKFRLSLPVNTFDEESTWRVFINGVASTLSITVPASTSGDFTTAVPGDSVAINAGDVVSFKLTSAQSGDGSISGSGSVRYDPSS